MSAIAVSVPSPLEFLGKPQLWWTRQTLYGAEDIQRPEPLMEAAAFSQLAGALTREAVGACNRDRFDQVAELQGLLEWTEKYCQHEPLASAYDRALCTFALLTAYGALSRLQHEEVYEQVELVRSLLAEGQLRRARHGLAVGLDSEMQLRCLSLLAEAKWLDNVAARDRVLTPRQIVNEYRRVAAYVPGYLASFEFPKDELPEVLQDHGWNSLAILKVALRYLPSEHWADVLDEFRAGHGLSLDPRPKEERLEPDLAGHELIWWLEWEIAKLACQSQPSQARLEALNRRRIEVASAMGYGVNFIQTCERTFAAISAAGWRGSLWSLAK
ncbi:hypothetical protein IT575_10975 [bacterium]|nr:hypothetical protein [bacterium]